MTTHDPRARLLHSAAIVAPAAAILMLGAFAGGPAPAPAGASPTPALDHTILAPPHPRPAGELARTLSWLAEVRLPAPGQSPMVRGAEAPLPDPVDAAPPEPPPEPVPDEPLPDSPGVPALKLTALLGASGGGIAVIDGRICTPGQEVAPGWRLTAVKADADCIEITSDEGRVERIRLRRPGDDH